MHPATVAQIGAIHTIAKRIGLDEESRRDLMAAATGKRSARDLSRSEAIRVIEQLKTIQGGREGPTARGARGLDGEYAPKLRALWISGWHLGVVRDRTDTALVSFLERQTGISHTRFLRSAADARKVIEALKGWLAREAGVEWPAEHGGSAALSKMAVYEALRRRLIEAGEHLLHMSDIDNMTEAEIDATIRAGGIAMRRLLKGGA